MLVDFATFAAELNLAAGLMVIAPHPDDETIGCGGLIALCTEAGISVEVVVVTDGAGSHPNSVSWPKARLVAQRQAETHNALAALGVHREPHFLGLPDTGTLHLSPSEHEQAVQHLAELIARSNPGVIATTWRREPHGDHQFSYALTRDALTRASSNSRLIEYMVWTAPIGDTSAAPEAGETQSLSLDITQVRGVKQRALKAHVSQFGGLILDDATGFALQPWHLEFMDQPFERFDWTPDDSQRPEQSTLSLRQSVHVR